LTATSTATITITLRAGSSHVDVAMKIDWQESNRLLRCVFPTNISNPSAWFDCHGVAVSRPVHRNTAVQQAAFEVPASGSAMLRGGIDTLHVTARGCFGWSALGATLGVSLLRATNYPDPTADRGTHEFAFTLRHATLADSTLSVCSRPGRTIADLDSALVPATLAGARTSQAGGGQAATQGRGVLQLVSQPDAETNIAAIKPAEDGSRAVIVRLRTYGQPDGTAALDFHAKAIAACWVDGLEQPVAGAPKLRLESDGRIELVGLKPGLSAVRIDLSA